MYLKQKLPVDVFNVDVRQILPEAVEYGQNFIG
jgi:hypothetical protein